MGQDNLKPRLNVISTPRAYFTDVVMDAIEKRKLEASPMASQYLVHLLESCVATENIQMKTTFAEMLLRAQQSEKSVKIDMLKKIGDTSLYLTGFFGDSLRRKIVDIDYYVEIGGIAYGNLASSLNEDRAEVFYEFSRRFLDFVDVLTYISQNTQIQSNQDLLRLYERYVSTGSKLAKEQLVEKGLINEQLKKSSNQ